MREDIRSGRVDMVLLLTVCVLLVFSIIMITSIGVPKSISLTKPSGDFFPSCGENGVDCFFLLRRHVLRIAIGLVGLYFAYKIPVRFWKKLAVTLFIVSVATLFALLIFGSSSNTFARAWFIVASTSIQPVEIIKLVIIFYLARWMESKGREVEDFKKGFISFCTVVGMIVVPALLQPDFGSALVFSVIATSMYFVSGARIRHILLGVASVFLVLLILVPNVHYLRYRFISFINPTVENCQPATKEGETRRNYCWQTEQAKIAVGSGGFFGKGLTQGIQKSYWLPQATDDFIFAASAEELGFIRIIAILACFLIIAYRGFLIAYRTSDKFETLVAVGITMWITSQAFINIGVNTGLFPVTGITLPFVSYGGTSMLATLAGVGILLQISRDTSSYANSVHRRGDRRTYLPKYRGYTRV